MLNKKEADWIIRFTAYDVVPEYQLAEGEKNEESNEWDTLQERFRILSGKQQASEQALKAKLIKDATGKIDDIRDYLKTMTQLEAERKDEGSGKKVTEKLRTDSGQVTDGGLETGESMGNVTSYKGSDGKKVDAKSGEAGKLVDNIRKAMETLNKQRDIMSTAKVKRYKLDAKAKDIIEVDELLFTKPEIAEEIYTPLVRDKVIGETLVPNGYSQVQSMLDGSDSYYLKECQEKGKDPDSGVAALAKGVVQVSSQVATAIFSSMQVAKTPGGFSASQGHDWSKDQVARFNEVTAGVAGVLSAGIDIVDQGIDSAKERKFNEDSFDAILTGISSGVGKIVGGVLGNDDIGGLVTIGIDGASKSVSIGAKIAKWLQTPGAEPPIDDIIKTVGGFISSGFSIKGDLTSGDESTGWSDISSYVQVGFNSAADMAKGKLLTALNNRQWKEVGKILIQCSDDAAKTLTAVMQNNANFNKEGQDPSTISGYTEQRNAKTGEVNTQNAIKYQSDSEKGIDQVSDSLQKLVGKSKGGEPLVQFKSDKDREAMQKQLEEFKKKEKKAKDDEAKEDEEQVKAIEEALKKEQKEYEDSLKCLGSKNPDDAEFKSIAKLIDKMQADRALVDGLINLFGGGIAVANGVTEAISTMASQVAPGLKAAGQFVKFVANCKAAHERHMAWLTWKEGRTDAISAVSPYTKAINNFVKNQGEQFAHYVIQATANAIQVLLAAGELSPYAPAFKAAGAAVGATASAEDAIYKFAKKQALKKAWVETKKALDPQNKNNRKMRLLVREINPTLAKYTIAYGAVIEEDPIAVTAMSRCGLDRETLVRTGDKVKDVKKYLEGLYPEDGSVYVTMDIQSASGLQAPKPVLTTKTWTVTYGVWSGKGGLKSRNPPEIVGNLGVVDALLVRIAQAPELKDKKHLLKAYEDLTKAFTVYQPLDAEDKPMPAIRKVIDDYADLSDVAATKLKMDLAVEEPDGEVLEELFA
jgi:hypothetical protein